jgi:molybdate transport system substrate-binding protein
MQKLFFLFLFFTFLSCHQKSNSNLTVAAAANIQFAIRDVISEFEKTHPIKTDLIIGSSGKLTAQIKQAAPYDVFLSADKKYPNALFDSKKAIQSPAVYVKGNLTIWTNKNLIINNLSDLLRPEFRKIAIANPKTAPYGREAESALRNAGILEAIKHKLVFGENIAQTNQYILSGTCDVGITAASTAYAKTINQKGHWVEVDPTLYALIEQGVVITVHGHQIHSKESKQFFDFLFSESAKTIFAQYGYQVE